MCVLLPWNSWVQNLCGKLLYKRKMPGYAAAPAIASSLENQLPMGVAAVLSNTFCKWTTVEIVGKEHAEWQGSITKTLLTLASTGEAGVLRPPCFLLIWVAACSQPNHGDSQWVLFPSFSFRLLILSTREKVNQKNHQDSLGPAACLPLRHLLLSES